MTSSGSRRLAADRDHGLVLPIVLVVVLILSIVVVAIADYASSTLRYGQVVEQSADRLATANGAMDNALESLDRGSSPCVLTTLANAGYEYDMLDPAAPVNAINGINPRVRCQSIGTATTGVEEFAVVLTGDPGTGTRSGALLTVNGSTTPRKVIDGPVFMAQRPNIADSLDLNAPLTIQNGDLWYPRTDCPASDVNVATGDLSITPSGFGVRCLETSPATWNALFASARPDQNIVVNPVNPAPAPPNPAGCTVWSPGRYTTAPALANNSYNYFQPGTYYFDNVGNWTIERAYALFGWPGPTGPTVPGYGNDTLANNRCVGAWESGTQAGATLYLGGNSRITIGANGALEITGSDQSGRFVALQALESAGTPSSVQGDAVPLVDIGSGSNKQISLRGLVWAPYASLRFDNVSNDAVAALTGGAIVSELSIQAPASATNFLIGRGNTPTTFRLRFTATANSPQGGRTVVKSIVTYRDGAYGLESRRVTCTTPDDPDAGLC